MSKNTQKKAKFNKYQIKIDAEIDLHGHTQAEATEATQNFLQNARKQNFKKIRIITGKGLHSVKGGVLRSLVKNILQAEDLMHSSSKINEGGQGSFDISL